jgi:hypothetical protein
MWLLRPKGQATQFPQPCAKQGCFSSGAAIVTNVQRLRQGPDLRATSRQHRSTLCKYSHTDFFCFGCRTATGIAVAAANYTAYAPRHWHLNRRAARESANRLSLSYSGESADLRGGAFLAPSERELEHGAHSLLRCLFGCMLVILGKTAFPLRTPSDIQSVGSPWPVCTQVGRQLW